MSGGRTPTRTSPPTSVRSAPTLTSSSPPMSRGCLRDLRRRARRRALGQIVADEVGQPDLVGGVSSMLPVRTPRRTRDLRDRAVRHERDGDPVVERELPRRRDLEVLRRCRAPAAAASRRAAGAAARRTRARRGATRCDVVHDDRLLHRLRAALRLGLLLVGLRPSDFFSSAFGSIVRTVRFVGAQVLLGRLLDELRRDLAERWPRSG